MKQRLLHVCLFLFLPEDIWLVSLSPRPITCSTGCIGDAIHPVLWEVGLGDSETDTWCAEAVHVVYDYSGVPNSYVTFRVVL